MIVTKRKTPKMYIIKFSFLKIFEKRHSRHYYFLEYSPHIFHELSSPRTLRNVLSNSRRASFAKLARSGGEAKITPLLRNS